MWLIDGRRRTRLPIEDRGLHYGDGLFETMAVIDGTVRFEALHLARLGEGCRRLGMPMSALAPLRDELAALARGRGRAVIKLLLTRGDGPRGYPPPQPAVPRRLLNVSAWPVWPARQYTRGVAVRVCETRLGLNPALAGVKHLNRLEQVMACREWRDARWQEGLMLDVQHNVVSGTRSNVFAVHHGRLLTPKLDRCGVAGVMRAAVRRQAPALDIDCIEQDLELDALIGADEVFLTNALIGIWPVRRLGEHRLRVGPVAHRLQQAMGLTGEGN